MAQFSMEIMRLTGSVLRGNQQAKALGVSQVRISEIVNGKRSISSETALRLSRYFGTTAEFWIGMQTTYELELARDRSYDAIAAEVKPRAA